MQTDEAGTTTTAAAAGRSAPVRPTSASNLPPGWTLLTPSRQRRRDTRVGGSPLRTPGSNTSTGVRAGGGGPLTPRKIAFEGGPGKRGNRYQALSGEGASEDEHEAYPYEDESSALLHGGG